MAIIQSNQASGAYKRAEFVSFDSPSAPQTTYVETAEPPTEQRVELAPGVALPTADEIEKLHHEAWKDGYAAGYEEGSARGRLEAAELHQLLQAFNDALSGFDQEVAEELQALAIEIARQVVRDTLQSQPEIVTAVIREALPQLPQQGATIHVHPEDSALIKQYLGDQLSANAHRLLEDESVTRGGCLIDSAGGQIDAQIATRWRRVVENISRSAAQFSEE
ncbi:flagellar assembly protein FliH [Viridibacterium curvum]|uniref:Flagellar assembly protein FliH n=1 Tax=Viridibacterium curvum TaxID=1101404 RepID=A0ABP9QYC2_9RHOO